MRTSMATLTQICMTLLLNNILPSDHNSDIMLPKCQLVYNIMTQISVHVAQLISDAIHQFVGIVPPRHPVDPEKSNRALGFSALIIGLCHGIPVAPTQLTRPPINRTFIEKYCMPRQVQQSGQDHRLHINHHPQSPSQLTCKGWSSRCTHTCCIWLINRQQTIGAKCS